MTKVFKATALAIASASFLASPAVAGEATEKVSFSFAYNEEASAEENYRQLRKQADRVCRTGGYVVSSFFGRKARQECSEALLTKAVTTSQRAELIALHCTPASTSLAAAAVR